MAVALILVMVTIGLAAPSSARAAAVDAPAGLSPQVTHGEPVPSADAYPWMVALLVAQTAEPDPRSGQYCGGSLIATGWVLTAAHCVDFWDDPAQLEIAVGQPDLEMVTTAERQSVTSIMIHPDWDPSTSANHDIALLQLGDPSRNASIPTLALVAADTNLELGTPGRVLGWGSTEDSSFPTFLRQGDVAVAAGPDSPTCPSLPTPEDPDDEIFFYVPATMVCAFGEVPPTPGKWVNTCGGDSGGPMLVDQDGGWAMAGLASWGDVPCGLIDFPSVFTRVTSHLRWIAIHVPELFVDPDPPVEPPVDPTTQPVAFAGIEPAPAAAVLTPTFAG